MYFLIHILVNALGYFTAISLLPGIHPTSPEKSQVLIIAVVAGLLNSIFLPIFRFFTFPMTIMTLGLWLFFLNIIMFWFVGYMGKELGFGFTVESFWTALAGALIVSFVSWAFGSLLITNR